MTCHASPETLLPPVCPSTTGSIAIERVALDRHHLACENQVPDDRLSDAAVAFEGDRRASGAA